ncbi:MAG: 50S ribosomal protein L29 [Methylococcaceae bacterium]
MKIQELRSKSVDDLNKMLKELYKEKFNLRMLQGINETPKAHLFRNARMSVAQIKTIITEKGGM